MREERDAIKSELGKKETAIALLKASVVICESQSQQAVEVIHPQEDVVRESQNKQAAVEPEPETENTESPAVAPEPITIQTEAPNTTTPPETDPGESELLTASQLAKKVNKKLEEIRKENKEKGIDENHNLPKPLKDYSLRDWFKKGSTCTDEYRALKQEEYGFKFSHCDKKGTLWFTIS